MHKIVRELKHGEKGVAVWGLGYIGYSSMAYFARAGIRCVGFDVLEEKVKQINENGKLQHKGETSLPNLDFWIGFDVEPMLHDGLIKATSNWKDLISNEFPVHLVAVPTEKADETGQHRPYTKHLKDVFENLARYRNIKTDYPPLVIVESTLPTYILDELIVPLLAKKGLKLGKDILLGIAPRRDWFVDPDKTLKTLPRVVGGTNKETTDLMADVLGLICDTVLKADDHNHASIVKSIENAYRQMEITLANQLSVAYPDLNMKHILKLVGTKWNIGTYHPSFGTGGYCIPLAPHYVLEGAKNPDALTLLKHSVEFDDQHPERVVRSLVERGVKKVGILGVAYTSDIKVHVLSPAVKITKLLQEQGIEVKVNDPYYSERELREITGAETFAFPEGLAEFDTVLVVSGHSKYRYTNHDLIKKNLKKCRLILDNTGAWKHIHFGSIEYHEAGDKNWLTSVKKESVSPRKATRSRPKALRARKKVSRKK